MISDTSQCTEHWDSTVSLSLWNLLVTLLAWSLFSSVAEHWSRKPGVVSSNLTGGNFNTLFDLHSCLQVLLDFPKIESTTLHASETSFYLAYPQVPPNRMDTRDGRHGLKKATYMLLAPDTLSVTAPR